MDSSIEISATETSVAATNHFAAAASGTSINLPLGVSVRSATNRPMRRAAPHGERRSRAAPERRSRTTRSALCFLSSFASAAATRCLAVAQRFALRRANVLRLLLPLAINLRLLRLHVGHQHSLPQTLVEVLQLVDRLHFQVERLRPSSRPFDRPIGKGSRKWPRSVARAAPRPSFPLAADRLRTAEY